MFAHNDDPEAILEARRRGPRARRPLCLEVMYAGDLLEQLQWDTLYHEHLTFYSLGTLGRLLERHGFEAVDAERIPMHGGSLRVARRARRAATRRTSVDRVAATEERDAELNVADTGTSSPTTRRRRIGVFGDTMRRLPSRREIWAYGAAGKATMWVNACEMDYLDAVVDASPLRAGKLMPGTHTPIVCPDEFAATSPTTCSSSAWNYLDAIRGNERDYEGCVDRAAARDARLNRASTRTSACRRGVAPRGRAWPRTRRARCRAGTRLPRTIGPLCAPSTRAVDRRRGSP